METAEKLSQHYLTCIICSEFFTNPATLQCDHTFCRSCLLKYTKTQTEAIQSKSIPCPVCKQKTKVTSPDKPVEDWVNQVKLSHLVQGLMDDFGPGTETEDWRLCAACKNEAEITKATSWCCECEEPLCDNCVKMHRRFSVTRNHEVSPLSGDLKQCKRRRFMCNEHTDELVKLFCRDCKKAMCNICSNINHRECKSVTTLESVMPEIKTSLVKKRDHFSGMIKEKSSDIDRQKDQMKKLLQSASSAESEITTVTQGVITKIREKERKLLRKVSALKERHMERLKSDQKRTETDLQTFQQQFLAIEKVVKSDSQKDMCVMYESNRDVAGIRSRDVAGRCSRDVVQSFHGGFWWNFRCMSSRREIAYRYDKEGLDKAIAEVDLGKVD